MSAPTLPLRIATYNTALVRVHLGPWDLIQPIPERPARRAALPDALSSLDFDVIALQEVYSAGQQRWLANQMRQRGWQAFGSSLGGAGLKRQNLGLMFLVKKGLSAETIACQRQLPAADWTEVVIAQKGYFALRLDGWLDLVNVHTTYGGFGKAFDGPKAQAIRGDQLGEIGERFANTQSLVLGDFNCGPHVDLASYRHLLDQHGYVDVLDPGASNPLAYRSWDPHNPLHHSILNQEGVVHDPYHGRIDQIFASSPLATNVRASALPMFFTQNQVAARGAKMPPQVPLSDHYGLAIELAR